MYQILCHNGGKKLSANDAYDLFKVEFEGLTGSTRREKEESANQYLVCFLMELGGELASLRKCTISLM